MLLLSALPEALPDTIVSRCISIPLAANGEGIESPERAELVELLRATAREKNWGVQQAYRVAQGLHSLLSEVREQIKADTAEALKGEETRYRNSTDGAWLDDREDYYKALTESLYIQRRAMLIEVLLEWWSDVLRACTGVARRDFTAAKKETTALPVVQASDTDTLRVQGEQRFRANCSRCHAAPQKFPSRMMATVLRHMRVRATITAEDRRLILLYMTQ